MPDERDRLSRTLADRYAIDRQVSALGMAETAEWRNGGTAEGSYGV